MKDVIVIGAGILGVTAARMLAKYELDVLVLEKGSDIGEGASKANSGVLAAGYHARGGSLKGISGACGNRMYRQIAEELSLDVQYTGSIHCAYHEEGIQELRKKMKRGEQNGVQGLRMISGDEARAMQPGLSEKVIGALYAPSTGIIDIYQLLVRSAQLAVMNGIQFMFDTEVTNIIYENEVYTLHTEKGMFQARCLINAAGENAAWMESFVCPQDLVIKPRRGQFLVFDQEEGEKLKYVLYQQQESDEKGCLLAPSVHGNIIAGPTSENVDSYKRVETTAWGIEHITKIAKKILPDIDMSKVIASFAGIRANITNVEKEEKDFVIRISKPHMVSALGIKNPGITAAPYLMQYALELLQKEGLVLKEKPDYHAKLPDYRKFMKRSCEEQRELLKEDPAYGNIICRCELVTEGDILAVLREPLPPKNMDGLKKRLRVGMGRCQGGFCTPRVISLLSKEWGVEPEKIVKYAKGSSLVKGYLK